MRIVVSFSTRASAAFLLPEMMLDDLTADGYHLEY